MVQAIHPSPRLLGALPLALLLLGCSDAGSRTDNLLHHRTTASVHLVSDPTDGFKAIHIAIAALEIGREGQWTPLSTHPQETFDLLALPGGAAPLATRVALPRAEYRFLRVTFDPDRSTVTEADGAVKPLTLPAEARAPRIFPIDAPPRVGNLVYDLALDLDPSLSIQRRDAGAGQFSYALHPVVRVHDRSSTGTLAGRLVDEQNRPLAGVRVTAQVLDPTPGGGPRVVRGARTGADGQYALDLLPFSRMHHAVCQPRVGDKVYGAQASPGFKPLAASSSQTFNATFQPLGDPAPVQGRIAAPLRPGQHDQVDLLQELATGERRGTFLIQSMLAEPGLEGAPSQYWFAPVPAPLPGASYQVRQTRFSLTPQGGTEAASEVVRPFILKANQKTDIDF